MNHKQQVELIAAAVMEALERSVPDVAARVKAAASANDPTQRLVHAVGEDRATNVLTILAEAGLSLAVTKDRRAVGPRQETWLRQVVGEDLASTIVDTASVDEDHRPGGAAYFSRRGPSNGSYSDLVRASFRPRRNDGASSDTYLEMLKGMVSND